MLILQRKDHFFSRPPEETMSSTRKNAAYNVAYRMFSVLLPMITAPYLSRAVGPEGVGLYSRAWSISYIFCLIAMLGLNDYGVRAIARVRDDQKELNRTFSSIWQMQILTAGATLILWLVYVFAIADEEKEISLHLTLMSVSCLVSFEWCLMGLDLFRPIALKNTFIKTAAALSVFVFVRKREDLWIYGLVWSLSTLLGNLSCVLSLRGRVKFVRTGWKESIRHLAPCSVLFISVLAVNVYRTMDKVMVSSLAGLEQNGLYENAEKIIYCLSGFISAIGTVMMPKISHMRQQGKTAAIMDHIDRSMNLMMCMVCALAFGAAAVADRFASLFYGNEFMYSGTLMAPLSFTLIMIGFANVIRTQWVLPNGQDTVFIKSVCSGAVVNLVFNFLLIPGMKSMGAVIGTLLAELTVPLVQFLLLRKQLDYRRYLQYTAVYMLIGTIMLACVRLIGRLHPDNTWPFLAVLVGAGVTVYGFGTILYWKITGQHNLFTGLFRKEKKASEKEKNS